MQITYVDFVLYELMDQHRLFEPALFEGFANLKVWQYPIMLSWDMLLVKQWSNVMYIILYTVLYFFIIIS